MRVSLCTIAKNEEAALSGLLKDFREQNYPHNKIEARISPFSTALSAFL